MNPEAIITEEHEEVIEETIEAEEQPTPTKLIWEGRWNHETNRAEWSQIEVDDEGEVKPALPKLPKLNRERRRALRSRLWHRVAPMRRYERSAALVNTRCPQCNLPFALPGKAPIAASIRAVLRCQCKPQCKPRVYTKVDTDDEEQAEQA